MPRGGLVVCQEIFGINRHIRNVTDGFAHEGFLAIAPALFDRKKPGVELNYTEEGTAEGRALRTAIDWSDVVADVEVAASAVAEAGKVGVVGYCWGGSIAWLAACRLKIAAAVGYYGGQIHEHRAETPGCPVMLHFGEHDTMIPIEQIDEVRRTHSEVEVFTYPAGHGFNCDARADFDEESAGIAAERTLAFLELHLG
jgi:carboxymethylenebutenolidase